MAYQIVYRSLDEFRNGEPSMVVNDVDSAQLSAAREGAKVLISNLTADNPGLDCEIQILGVFGDDRPDRISIHVTNK